MIQNFSYGKSGGQGISPLIVVTAPTGSTVTCDGVQGTEVSGTWTFPVIIGTHTIVATQGSNTKTQTVVVDQVAVFNVTITFIVYLYNEGDECTSITGGWLADTSMKGTVTKNSDNIRLYRYCDSYGSTSKAQCYTNNVIDLTSFGAEKLYVDFSGTFNNRGAYKNNFYITAQSVGIDICSSSTAGTVTFNRQVKSFNISDFTGTASVISMTAVAYQLSGDTTTMYFYKIWLE